MRKAAAAQGVSSINIQQAGAVTLRRQGLAVQTKLGLIGTALVLQRRHGVQMSAGTGVLVRLRGETLRNCSGNVANTTGGKQTRTATCTSGSGWSYGSWTGICTCRSNFTWSNNRCVKGGMPSGWSWHLSAMNPINCKNASSSSCGTCSQSNGGTSCIVTISEDDGSGIGVTHCYFDCLGM